MSNFVFVLDAKKCRLNPIQPGWARKLLTAGKASVFRRYPFTILLKKAVTVIPEPITLKIDPGSKTTGIALVQGDQVIWGAELTHRGQAIKASLESRRAIRRGRRNRHTRYRQARFKFVTGFQTGDLVKAIVTTGKKIGKYTGRVAVRSSGLFNISASELVQGISHKYCQVVHRKDGYSYSFSSKTHGG